MYCERVCNLHLAADQRHRTSDSSTGETGGHWKFNVQSEGKMLSIDSTVLTYDAWGRMVEQNQSGTYYQIAYTPMGKKLGMFKGQTIQEVYVPLPGGDAAEYLSWGLSHYRHSDWQGSHRLESSTGRSVVDNNAYGPFGEPYAQSGNGEITFTGQNSNTIWPQYDFMDRQYQPQQGRWLSPDRMGLGAVDPASPQSWNRYAYVQNNPLAMVDPFGDQCYDPSGNEVGGGSKDECLSGAPNGTIWIDANTGTISQVDNLPASAPATPPPQQPDVPKNPYNDPQVTIAVNGQQQGAANSISFFAGVLPPQANGPAQAAANAAKNFMKNLKPGSPSLSPGKWRPPQTIEDLLNQASKALKYVLDNFPGIPGAPGGSFVLPMPNPCLMPSVQLPSCQPGGGLT